VTLQFVDETGNLDASWVNFASTHDASPMWLAEVNGRYVGCFAIDVRTLAGLRPWDDALEGDSPGPWVLFEVEKLVRMALHQSGLAFEALASAHCWGDFLAREVANAAATQGLLAYYRDIARPLIEGNTESWRWRALLTGVAIAREGIVSLSLPRLSQLLGAPLEPDVSCVDELLASLADSQHLPDRPANYDLLNDVVVDCRMRST
jgi:hypothetical protein